MERTKDIRQILKMNSEEWEMKHYGFFLRHSSICLEEGIG
jgi:hypothetical protein